MIALALHVVGSLILVLWGIAHVVPVRQVVRGFGSLSRDNKHIASSTWIAEGLALIFVGVVEGLVAAYGVQGGGLESKIAYAGAAFLLVLAGLDVATKARNPHLAMRLCPAILTSVAAAYIASAVLPL